MKTLSPYKVSWIEFKAIKGIVTQRDAKVLRKYNTFPKGVKFGKTIYEWFADKESAQEYLKTRDFSKLSKKYEARIFTDKQFSMTTCPTYEVKFTSKQEKEMIVIGN